MKAGRAAAALNSLALGLNPVGDKAMIQLLEVLKDVSLTHLDISETKCGVSTASKLAELLSQETKFKAAIARLSIAGEFRILHMAPSTHDNTSLTNCIVHIALRNGSKPSRG